MVHQVDRVRCLGLPQDLQHAVGVGGVRHDEVSLVAHPVDDQVLDHAPALVEHEVVLRLPHLDRRDVVRDNPLQERQRARPVDLDLAEVREIEEPHVLANRSVLGERARVFDRHVPTPERAELGPECGVLGLQRRVLQLPGVVHAADGTRPIDALPLPVWRTAVDLLSAWATPTT